MKRRIEDAKHKLTNIVLIELKKFLEIDFR